MTKLVVLATAVLAVVTATLTLVACGKGPREAPGETPCDDAATRAHVAPKEPRKVDLARTGRIIGRIAFRGWAPVMARINLTEDACRKQHADKPLREETWVIDDGGVRNVVVWIKGGLEGVTFPAAAMRNTATIQQIGCQYVPHVVGLTAGGELSIENCDPIQHNVHLEPSIRSLEKFGSGSKEKTIRLPMTKPESPCYRLLCDIHAWMKAYVVVLPHPCFAISGADGQFAIENVPAGRYVLEAWHESGKTQTMEIEVEERAEAHAVFTMQN